MIARRSLLAGILGAAVAPAVITRPGILMPVRKIVVPEPWWMTASAPQIHAAVTARVFSANALEDVLREIKSRTVPSGSILRIRPTKLVTHLENFEVVMEVMR